jgi:hypothetical protein
MKKLILILTTLFIIGFSYFIYDCFKFYIVKQIKCPYLQSRPLNALMVSIEGNKIRIDTIAGYLTYKNLWYCKEE